METVLYLQYIYVRGLGKHEQMLSKHGVPVTLNIYCVVLRTYMWCYLLQTYFSLPVTNTNGFFCIENG